MKIKMHIHMTYTVRECGLPSVDWLSKNTDVSRQTLSNWHKNRPKLFKIILLGALKVYQQKDNNNV